MARGRIIDRDFFSHEILGELSLNCRYLYLGLITFADDEGRLKANPKYLKVKIFPYDDISEKDIEVMVNQLVDRGLTVVYQVETVRYLHHPKWEKWQPIRKDRFKPSNCPSPVDGIPMVNQVSTNPTPLPNLTKPNITTVPSASFKKPTIDEIHAHIEEKGLSVDAEAFFAFYESNGWRVGRNPMKSWKAALMTWQKNSFNKPKQEIPSWLQTK